MSIYNKAAELRRIGKRNSLLVLSAVVALLLLSSLLYIFLINQQNAHQRPTTSRQAQSTATLPSFTSTLTVLFSENFTDNSQNWNVGSRPGYSSTIRNSSLTLTETNHHLLREPLPLDTSYTDFTITTTFTIDNGDDDDSVGLYLRSTDDSAQGYYIDIDGSDRYDIAKITTDTHHNAQPQYILEPTTTTTLHPQGQPNTMTVIMKGTSIVLLINTTFVTTVHDSTFTNGGMSLFVDNATSSKGVSASFSNVTVYDAPAQLPH